MHKKLDQNANRITSSLVSLLGIMFIFSHSLLIAAFLLYDFSARVFGYAKLSPLFHASSLSAKILKLKKDNIDAGPKEFALKIGYLLVIGVFISLILKEPSISTYIMSVLVVCTLLEAAANYCVGCKFYTLLKRFF